MLTQPEAAEALYRPIAESGRSTTADVIAAMVTASGCYPFAVQLIGYEAWRHRPDATQITLADVTAAVRLVEVKLGQMVYEPSLADLSPRDRDFVRATAIDDGPSRLSDIAERRSPELLHGNAGSSILSARESRWWAAGAWSGRMCSASGRGRSFWAGSHVAARHRDPVNGSHPVHSSAVATSNEASVY
jgi:hypothetical protein